MWPSILPTALAEAVENECATYDGALRHVDFKLTRLNSKRNADAEMAEWQAIAAGDQEEGHNLNSLGRSQKCVARRAFASAFDEFASAKTRSKFNFWTSLAKSRIEFRPIDLDLI